MVWKLGQKKKVPDPDLNDGLSESHEKKKGHSLDIREPQKKFSANSDRWFFHIKPPLMANLAIFRTPQWYRYTEFPVFLRNFALTF